MILFAHGGMLDIASRGFFGATSLELMNTELAVIIGIVCINLPFTILTLQSVFEGIDPRLEEAAASMGAPPARSFRRVVLPLAMPGVLIAGALCFILAMNAFATPLLLGGPRFQMMAPLLYWEFSSRNDWPRPGLCPDGEHARADLAGQRGGTAAVSRALRGGAGRVGFGSQQQRVAGAALGLTDLGRLGQVAQSK